LTWTQLSTGAAFARKTKCIKGGIIVVPKDFNEKYSEKKKDGSKNGNIKRLEQS